MKRLTVNPESLFFKDVWTVYIHLQSISTNFSGSFVKVYEIKTIADFWKIVNHLPSCENLHSDFVYVDQKRVIAYSIFKNSITPEWEHPINSNGSEWGCREAMSAEYFSHSFYSLVLSAVNNEFDHVVGVRCINKSNKQRILHKIEVWMDTVDYDEIMWTRHQMSNVIHDLSIFIILYHEDKQNRAKEFSRKKIRKCKLSNLKIK